MKEWYLAGITPEDHSGFISGTRNWIGIHFKDACAYSQIVLASSMMSKKISKISNELESLDTEGCRKRAFQGRPLYSRCCNFHHTTYCSQKKMKDGSKYSLLLADHLLSEKQLWNIWVLMILFILSHPYCFKNITCTVENNVQMCRSKPQCQSRQVISK